MSFVRLRWFSFALSLLAVEVLIATVWKHVPFVRADLGDALATLFLYALVRSVWATRPVVLGTLVLLVAFLIELSQAFGLADRLGLAPGSVLRIAIGTTFQVSDLGMYLAGTLAGVLLDRAARRHGG